MNRRAFESYQLAKRQVARYGHTFDLTDLDIAIKALDDSITADNKFFKAAHYKGIVYDMQGDSKKADEQLGEVLAQAPDALKNEVEFNLAVAKYHRYSKGFIEEAIAILQPLELKVPSHEKLNWLVKAVLAQCYGMMAHHASKTKPEDVDEFVEQTKKKAKEATSQLAGFSLHRQEYEKQVLWISNNAKGIGLMFRDDKDRDNWQKGDEVKVHRKRLEDAIGFFDTAADYSKSNWAITCNQASARMRIGHLLINQDDDAKAGKYFEEAEQYLLKVIQKLRPNYDFAYYELGRINRFKMKIDASNKQKALDYFKKAKESHGNSPNISDHKINLEIHAVEEGNTAFTLPDPPPAQATS